MNGCRDLGYIIQIDEKPCSISDHYELGTNCIAGVLWRRKKYFDIFRRNPFVDLYLFIFKSNTKSSVFLHTAHLIHIAVPSFHLALCKAHDSSFANINFHHGCVSRNFPKFLKLLLRRTPVSISLCKLRSIYKSCKNNQK